MTGNITTRNRSTRPARSSDRHRLRLPIVLSEAGAVLLHRADGLDGVAATRVVLAHVSGSSSDEEKTTFGAR